MSDIYVRLLLRVRDEHDTADASLRYVQDQWRRQNLEITISNVTPADLQRAIDSLDATFFIHLFSVFEGMLRQHIEQHHPGLSIEEDARAVWLIDRVARLQSPPLSAALRDQVHEVRRNRNLLVHLREGPRPMVLFRDALARLSKFVDRLPEPRP